METAEERKERIRDLEQTRRQRRGQDVGGTVWPTPDDAGTGVIPLEIAPGRGDLNTPVYGFMPTFPTALGLVGGRTVSFARIFQAQPRVYSAVMRLMGAASRVPLKLYRLTGEENARERVHPGEHPLADALVSPWERGNQVQLVTALLGPVLVHGNAVMELQISGNSVQFQALDWRFTKPLMPFRDSIVGFAFNTDSPRYRFERAIDDVLHINWWSPVGPVGTSPLMALGVTLNIEDAAQRHQVSQFTHGARPPSAVVMSPDYLDLPAQERRAAEKQLRSDLTALYVGPDNQGRPLLLPPGLDYRELSHSTAVEAALVEQRKLTKEEIFDVYQLPQLPDRATAQTMDMIRQMIYVDALGPPLILLEQGINAQVIRAQLREDDLFVEFDFGGVLRGDRLAEIQALREAIATALMTPNEGRDALNMPRSPLPESDQFFMPFNNLWPVNAPPNPGQKPQPPNPQGQAEPADTQQPGTQPGARRLHVRSRDRNYVREYVEA